MRLDWSQFQTEILEMEGDKNEKGRFLSFKFNFENSLSFSSFSFFCVFSLIGHVFLSAIIRNVIKLSLLSLFFFL